MLDYVGAFFYVLSARLGQKLNLLQCLKTFTFHFDQAGYFLYGFVPRLLTLGPGFDTRSGNILSYLLPLFSRRAVVSYWRKYVHEILVNRLGGLNLPRKSVVRLTDRPDMTLDVYRGRKTTMQQQQQLWEHVCSFVRYS